MVAQSRDGRFDAIIYGREIVLDVVIPEGNVWEFMKEFGKEFAEDQSDGAVREKPVERYYSHPGGWHLQVSVGPHQEGRFYIFLRRFCADRALRFRDPKDY